MQKNCADEVIHLCQTIQPHGALLALDAAGRVENVSLNAAEIVGLSPRAVLGMRARRALATVDGVAWRQAVQGAKKGLRPILLLGQRAGRECAATLHRQQERWMLEVETDIAALGQRNTIWQQIEQAQAQLSTAANLGQCLKRLAQVTRKMTGFDRVKIYQFGQEGHGQVLAESRHESMESFLGHHFPASDIPPQSRALLCMAVCRSIVDIAAVACPVVGAATRAPASTMAGDVCGLLSPAGPVDMARAVLRPAAQVHREYLANMQVAASLTLSLMVDGKLWGLVACHHRVRRHVSPSLRQACEFLAQHAAVSIATQLSRQARQQSRWARQRVVRVASQIGQAADLGRLLTQHQPNIMSLVESHHGAGAAVLTRSRWSLVGKVPSLVALEGLERWLCASPSRSQFFATCQLAKTYPPAQDFVDIAAGLIALRIAGPEPIVIMWLLPEAVYSQVWAGVQNKPVMADEAGQLHPRASFARFTETVRGRCRSLTQVELSAARQLRRYIVEDNLHRQVFSEKMVRSDAQRQRRRTTLLAEATRAASSGLDVSSSGRALAQSLTSFCDLCEVYLMDPSLERGWQRLAACHRTKQGQAIADGLDVLPALSAEGVAALQAQRGRRDSLLLPIIGATQMHQLAPDPALRHVLSLRLGLTSVVIAPMVVRQEKVGMLALWRSGLIDPLTLDDDELAMELANRAAIAVGNARSFRQATDALAVRDHILDMVSHDLRNPLSLIMLTLDHMKLRQQRLGSDDFVKGLDKSLGRIASACAQMDRLISDILCLSKLDAGTLVQHLAPCRVAALLRDAVDQIEPLVQARGMRLACSTVDGGDAAATVALPVHLDAADSSARLAGYWVACDPGRILQVFGNLIGNAIKFSRPPATIHLRIALRAQSVVFAIVDRGPGIAPAEIDHVFERHYQADRHGRRGTGLGLAIVRGIVEAHAGTVTVESELEVGSTFSFTLPRVPPPSQAGTEV